jgi:hypothetical protein
VAKPAMTGSPLTHEERQLLDEVVASRDPALRALADDVAAGRILTISEANALRDAIGDELAESGIDEDVAAINERAGTWTDSSIASGLSAGFVTRRCETT